MVADVEGGSLTEDRLEENVDVNDGPVGRPKRRNLVAGVLFAAAVVLVAVALGLGFLGRSRQSAASDARDATDVLDDERRDLERSAEDAEECQREYRQLADEVATAGIARIDAARDFNESAGAVVDAQNAAVDQANAGNLAGAQAMYENDVAAAIAAADDDLARVQQTLDVLQDATEQVREAAC